LVVIKKHTDKSKDDVHNNFSITTVSSLDALYGRIDLVSVPRLSSILSTNLSEMMAKLIPSYSKMVSKNIFMKQNRTLLVASW